MESFTLGLMRGDGAPLYRQLYRHIVEEIASGGLAAGEKLPSKRRLAADLRVSVSTVETAGGLHSGPREKRLHGMPH